VLCFKIPTKGRPTPAWSRRRFAASKIVAILNPDCGSTAFAIYGAARLMPRPLGGKNRQAKKWY